MIKKVYFIETQYQFLVALSLVVSERNNLSHDSEYVFIDSTLDGFVYSNKTKLDKSFGVEVLEARKRSFYTGAFFTIFEYKKYIFEKLKTEFYFFSNRSPMANKISSFYPKKNVFLVEEGLSLYGGHVYNSLFSKIKKIFKDTLISTITLCRYDDEFGKSKYNGTVLLRFESLYENKQCKDLCQLPDLRSLLGVSKKLDEIFTIGSFSDFNFNGKNIAIYFGQPLSELNKISLEEELNIIGKLRDHLLKTNIRLVIKEHPRDRINKYFPLMLDTIPKNIPAELLGFKINEISAIFSFYSTAAVNVGLALRVPTYFLYDMLQDRELSEIVSFPKDIVRPISCFDEIEKITECNFFGKNRG